MRDRFMQFWKMTERQTELSRIAKLKSQLYKAGCQNQLSLYGICTTETVQGDKYRRIEVFSDKPFLKPDIHRIYTFFSGTILPKVNSIWVYHDKQLKELTLNG